MRILYITDSLERGGAEKQMSIVADRVRQFGHESVVIALTGGGYWESYLKEHGVPVTVLNLPTWRHATARALREFGMLVDLVRSHRPHVAVSFPYHCSVWGSWAAAQAGVPIVIGGRRDCEVQRAVVPLPRWLEKRSYAGTTFFVCNSLAVVESVRQSEGLQAEHLEVIYNAVDVPARASEARSGIRRKLGVSDSTVVVAMVANFYPHKNQLLLVRAAARVVPDHGNVVFVLAGGYWDYQEDVEREIATLGLQRHVRIVGPVQGAAQLLPAVDIGVQCSESEGLSNAILEHMAYAKPIVATRVGGNPELVIEGETGYLVDRGDASALADAILALANDPAARVKLGGNGRARVEEQFSWEVALRDWDRLYCRLASGATDAGHQDGEMRPVNTECAEASFRFQKGIVVSPADL